jgi:DHA3 family macrolide efflux protein-like MFS transporter
MNNNHHTPMNMRTFWIIWGGQFVSMLGSGLTSFGLGVWIYDQTGQATPFALTALFSTLPALILMPIGGAIADRYSRRMLMILSDTGSAIITALAAVLLIFGDLQVWHIYLLAFFASVFGAFQEPAYSASITMLVPKKDLARASGIMQMGQAGSAILTPILAGGLYALIGLKGVIIIDAVTYFFAIGALFIVRIPQPKRISAEPGAVGEKQSLLTDAAFGWKYLRALPGLFGLLVYFASVNFFLNFSSVLSGPLVLSYGSATDLGIVQMVSGAAMLTGSLIMSAWGGPKKRKIPTLIGFIALAVTGLLISGLRANTWLISAGNILLLVFIPFASALSQAVFQTKVPPGVQGRVFSIRSMISRSMMPIAFLLSGPLADRIFNPLMAEGGALASTFLGRILGTGPGRGIGLLMIVSCLFMWTTSLMAYANPRIRNLEEEIPDAIPDEESEVTEILKTGEPLAEVSRS